MRAGFGLLAVLLLCSADTRGGDKDYLSAGDVEWAISTCIQQTHQADLIERLTRPTEECAAAIWGDTADPFITMSAYEAPSLPGWLIVASHPNLFGLSITRFYWPWSDRLIAVDKLPPHSCFLIDGGVDTMLRLSVVAADSRSAYRHMLQAAILSIMLDREYQCITRVFVCEGNDFRVLVRSVRAMLASEEEASPLGEEGESLTLIREAPVWYPGLQSDPDTCSIVLPYGLGWPQVMKVDSAVQLTFSLLEWCCRYDEIAAVGYSFTFAGNRLVQSAREVLKTWESEGDFIDWYDSLGKQ